MQGRLASFLAGLFLATVTAGATAHPPGCAATAATPVDATPPGRSAHAPQVAIEQLHHAVFDREARRQEVQRRLSEQDREIQALRHQLQAAGRHESARLH